MSERKIDGERVSVERFDVEIPILDIRPRIGSRCCCTNSTRHPLQKEEKIPHIETQLSKLERSYTLPNIGTTYGTHKSLSAKKEDGVKSV